MERPWRRPRELLVGFLPACIWETSKWLHACIPSDCHHKRGVQHAHISQCEDGARYVLSPNTVMKSVPHKSWLLCDTKSLIQECLSWRVNTSGRRFTLSGLLYRLETWHLFPETLAMILDAVCVNEGADQSPSCDPEFGGVLTSHPIPDRPHNLLCSLQRDRETETRTQP